MRVCLEQGAWLRAHVRVAGSGQRRRRSEKEICGRTCVYTYVRPYIRLIASVEPDASQNTEVHHG